MKLVYIEWEDAIAQTGWHNEDEMEEWAKRDNMITKEVGWVYKENKTHLILVSRMLDEETKDRNYKSFGLLQKIPKTWIRKRKIIKL